MRTFLKYVILFLAAFSSVFVARELHTSGLQARIIAPFARELKFRMDIGPSPSIRFPIDGPYNLRMGYAQLPGWIESLSQEGYGVFSQARQSPNLVRVADWGIFPTYHEKIQGGLRILDDDGRDLFRAEYPERLYGSFEEIPRLIIETLLFIENRELLDTTQPFRNPAVEWDRTAKAFLDVALSLVDHDRKVEGGSTLATQIEKYRHSPGGITSSVGEKLRQMISATLRGYLDGEDTLMARRQIVLNYLNSVPLAASPGYGEVKGIGDGLWVWYGSDFDAANRLLRDDPENFTGAHRVARARAFREVLSLLLAQRRPSYYLMQEPDALSRLTERYLALLTNAGIIPFEMRDAAANIPPSLRKKASPSSSASFLELKGANAIRTTLLSWLGHNGFYDLDRLDLTVGSTIDLPTQQAVTKALRALLDPAAADAANLRGDRLLEKGDPGRLIYSFTLYERGTGANLLRVQTDNYDGPLSINEGTKLDLGSTAKLRTLVHYLEIVEALYYRYAHLSVSELQRVRVDRSDRLSRWAVDYLATDGDGGLTAMLDAAMRRQYPASPAKRFFTGGGLHRFENFNHTDDHKVLTVQEAFYKSVNLVFIRLMRDMAYYHTSQSLGGGTQAIDNLGAAERRAYLSRFADREGREFLRRFWTKYAGKSSEEALAILLRQIRATPKRLAIVFRSVKPNAGMEEFVSFTRALLPAGALSEKALRLNYNAYSPAAYSLADRAYLSRVHPLELWLVAYLVDHPTASWSDIIQVSAAARQEAYAWLFKSRRKTQQDKRIRIMLEVEAFHEIHRAWKRLGYPFDSLVPSYATAIGSSGDRPGALAELVGIILNGGVRYPMVRTEWLHFAEGTPYETLMRRRTSRGELVLSPEVAAVVQRALLGVVESGTAQRARGSFLGNNGRVVQVGGKTGTGDNRYETYAPGGRLIGSRVVNRTATFVFFIEDRFFGTMTAFVPGEKAADYRFTSSLPVELLKVLWPKLVPLIDAEDRGIAAGPYAADPATPWPADVSLAMDREADR